jgi:hypothetical protein
MPYNLLPEIPCSPLYDPSCAKRFQKLCSIQLLLSLLLLTVSYQIDIFKSLTYVNLPAECCFSCANSFSFSDATYDPRDIYCLTNIHQEMVDLGFYHKIVLCIPNFSSRTINVCLFFFSSTLISTKQSTTYTF